MAVRFFKKIWITLRDTFREFRADNAYKHGAGLAYFTIFSLPPILIILISLAGTFFGEAETQTAILHEVSRVMGEETARSVGQMMESRGPENLPWYMDFLGIATLIFGASGVFFHLKDSLNTLWGVPRPPKQGFFKTIQDRILSFTMVFMIGFLLLVSLVIQTVLVAVNRWLHQLLPDDTFLYLISFDFILSIVVITTLIAMLFRFLPDAKIVWKDSWIGALFTSTLFTAGQFVIGWYIGNQDVASAYGAAGSLIIILLWVFFSAQVLFFGAKFTLVYSKNFGTPIVPMDQPNWFERVQNWYKKHQEKKLKKQSKKKKMS